MNSPEISIVIAVCNEEENINELYNRLTSIMEHMEKTYEILFVNDGSTDMSFNKILDLRAVDNRVKLIDLSRNFGHQIAITAGLDHAQGNAVVVMDADLQDPPELIQDLYHKYKEGYDVVYAVRKQRKGETFLKKGTARIFYRVLQRITRTKLPLDTGDFRLMSKDVVETLGQIREYHRFVRGLTSWIGFEQIGVEYIRDERFAGKTKYSFIKMVKFALDGITSFSYLPLQLASYLGFASALFAFFVGLWAIYAKLFAYKTVPGWTSLMVVVLFLGGVQLFTLGIIGEYLGRINDEVKRRPLYVIRKLYE